MSKTITIREKLQKNAYCKVAQEMYDNTAAMQQEINLSRATLKNVLTTQNLTPDEEARYMTSWEDKSVKMFRKQNSVTTKALSNKKYPLEQVKKLYKVGKDVAIDVIKGYLKDDVKKCKAPNQSGTSASFHL